MSVSSWRRPLVTLVVLAAGAFAMACSDAITRQAETGAIGSSGTAPAAIGIVTTSSFITVENRAGLPLLDVAVTVKAANGLSFSKSISRLEASAKRDMSLGELRSNDGTTFSMRFHKPREVVITATDVVGKKYDVTTPWK
jgi:hypothetical protein